MYVDARNMNVLFTVC